MNTDADFLRLAIALAGEHMEAGDGGPFGAVIVYEGQIVAEGWNQVTSALDPTAHAEVLVMRAAGEKRGNYRLGGLTLYVTLEPCAMCAGALVQARVQRLVFGARDLRFGGVRAKFRIADSDLLNHRVDVTEGVLGAECLELLKSFFAARRD